MTSAKNLTTEYEKWLGAQIPLIEVDVEAKHTAMAGDEFTFFRATYYLWLARVAEQQDDLLKASGVPIVGDLHVENFGTWRDDRGALRWGVNDFDELAHGPWVLDVLRLATSAALSPHVDLAIKDIVAIALDAYADAAPGPALAVADHKHLAALVPDFKDAGGFFRKLAAGDVATDLPPEVTRAAAASAGEGWEPIWHIRQAGAGSLGHRRVVGVGAVGASQEAREAKQLDPGTAAWAQSAGIGLAAPASAAYPEVHTALDLPSAAARAAGWQLRALAPDEVRIDLSGLTAGDAELVLRSMVTAMVAVHGIDGPAYEQARKEAADLDPKDLRALVHTMVDVMQADAAAFAR